MEHTGLFDLVWKEVLITIVVAGVLSIVGFTFKHLRHRGDRLAKIEANQSRIVKTLIVITKLIDAQTEKAHEGITSELEEIAKEILKNGK